MVSSRKRGRQEMEAPVLEAAPQVPSLISQLRNMWEFANLAQWIFIFGRAVKIDENFDIEELEMECLKTHSTVLPEIGLALLKFVSSHRGLTPEIFDEYTRKQYVAKAPERNPYGEEEEPAKFAEFDVFTKIRVLQQLTQWTMINPDRIRERMEEKKDTEQSNWRIEPCGWDVDDREYYILDDNRLYRRTEAPPPPPPAPKYKKNSKKGKAAARAAKRRKLSEGANEEDEPAEDGPAETKVSDNGFGGAKWECVAVTLDEYNQFLATIEKTRDPNEKVLRKTIVDDALPILEKQEEARRVKAEKKRKELINIEKLATAKRSSRIAGKMEQQKQEEEAREAERKKQEELVMARKEREKWKKLEKERESRIQTREQRLKEREARRILQEEELASLSEDSKKLGAGAAAGRLSERHLKAEIEKKKQALEELTDEEDWFFDCVCGENGQGFDDGTHSIACETCNVWQHSKCVGVDEKEADEKGDDFHFICSLCKRRADDAERAKNKPPLMLKFRAGSSSSTTTPKQNGVSSNLNTAGPQNGNPAPVSSPQKMPQMHLFQPKTNGSYKSPQSSQESALPKPHINDQEVPNLQPRATVAETEQELPQPGSPVRKAKPKPSLNGRSPSIGANPFSSPLPHSPTSLPPPIQSFTNGPEQNRSPSKQRSSPASSPVPQSAELPKQIVSGEVPIPPLNGIHREQEDQSGRRSSFNFSSPLVGAPVLTPKHLDHPMGNSTFDHTATPTVKGSRMASFTASSPPFEQDEGHASALPSSASGISPVKHSPPRPSTSATPHVLPPKTSLSPSPQAQDLTPPVKHSEPEGNHSVGQSIAH